MFLKEFLKSGHRPVKLFCLYDSEISARKVQGQLVLRLVFLTKWDKVGGQNISSTLLWLQHLVPIHPQSF